MRIDQEVVGMRMRIDNLEVAYDDVGSGPAVVLIHGFPLNRRMWQPQLTALAAAGYRVIAPDLRGFGESAPGDGPWTMERFADDVAVLLDRLGILRAAVVGMSMGGYVLLTLLERHPSKVAAAVWLCSRASGDDEVGKARRTQLADEVEAGRPQVVTGAFSDALFAPQTPKLQPALITEVAAFMQSASLQGLAGGLRALRDRKDYTPLLGRFGRPALVFGAEHDRAVPAEQARQLAAGLPHATYHLIPEAGHMANLEQPDEVNRRLLDFLAAVRPVER